MFILMILYDLCSLPAQFSYTCIIIYIWKVESHVQIAYWCAPLKISCGAENRILQALQFQVVGVCRKFLDGASINHY
jgi:hypothetical protein